MNIAASLACVDLYMNIHVSELKTLPKPAQECWKVGQEIYNLGKRATQEDEG